MCLRSGSFNNFTLILAKITGLITLQLERYGVYPVFKACE